MRELRILDTVLAFSLAAILTGCTAPPRPEEFFQPVSPGLHQIKNRVFESGNEVDILKACANVLMDNNFQINAAESKLGWISAVKHKAAPGLAPVRVGATVLVYPAAGRPGMSVVQINLDSVDDAEIYQELFGRIAQVLFVKAQPI